MRRRNRFAAALSLAVLLLAGVAPPATAGPPPAPVGRLGVLVDAVAAWWLALWTGDGGGQKGVAAASETEPSPDPDGNELAPRLDPNGLQAAPEDDPGGNEKVPSLDPNG